MFEEAKPTITYEGTATSVSIAPSGAIYGKRHYLRNVRIDRGDFLAPAVPRMELGWCWQEVFGGHGDASFYTVGVWPTVDSSLAGHGRRPSTTSPMISSSTTSGAS